MSDTWVAMDGRDPTTYYLTCWICDCGPYLGPIPQVLGTDGSWIPADADRVYWLIALPNPSGDTAHVADGTYLTQDCYTVYQRTATAEIPGGIDPGAHLFVAWQGIDLPDDPADLIAPSASPLDLVPASLVAGGRLGGGSSSIGVFTVPITMPAVRFGVSTPGVGTFTVRITVPPARVVDTALGVLTVPVRVLAVAPVTAGAVAGFGVFSMPVGMAPLAWDLGGLDAPPEQMIGDSGDVWATDGDDPEDL